jgi:metal-dependent amidase/aminoacylase/carboxypeptidase family protein
MTKAELMQRVQAAVDRRGEEIIALGEEIRRQPELGFKEFKTAKLVARTFERIGLAPRTGVALTGGLPTQDQPPRNLRRLPILNAHPR